MEPTVAIAERDACGVGFVADVRGRRSHAVLGHALTAVANLSHRGAVAADGKTGDGAGVLTQLPYALLRRDLPIDVPDDHLGAGMLFLPATDRGRAAAVALVEEVINTTALSLLGWRDVPTDPSALGTHAAASRPHIAQVVVAGRPDLSRNALERALYLCRRRIERRAAEAGLDLYVPSFSSRTVVYKALLTSPALPRFYADLLDPEFQTAIAIFHQRYSTNTFPSWRLAQPFRFLAHNGEINTLQGNALWMRAREPALEAAAWGEQIRELVPVIQEGGSDSAMLDNVVELLAQSGRRLPHALLMLVPQAWEGLPDIDESVRAFYAFHACLTEPWDGPAALAFSDGAVVGSVLDRNGLRPARYLVTRDGLVVMASEAGVLEIPAGQITEKGRLGPGQMLLVDTDRARLLRDHDVKAEQASARPYREWVRRHLVQLAAYPPDGAGDATLPLVTRQRIFGYASEDVERILRPMVLERKDPVFSMGDDTPAAVFSTRPRLLYDYLKQRFAQVTNPPIDPLRERMVMSLATYLGPRPSFLDETPVQAQLLLLRTPILLPDDLRWIREHGPFPTVTLDARFPATGGAAGLAQVLDGLVEEACAAARTSTLVILSDTAADDSMAPVPMLLAVAAVHYGLIRAGLRMRTSLLVETAEARDIHQLACLAGYGAGAICPTLALQTVGADAQLPGDVHTRWAAYRAAAEAGLLKIMSKMGISTFPGYCGAQLLEAIGLDQDLVERFFPGTPSRIGGIGLEEIAAETLARHRRAFASPGALEEAGDVRFRREGEYHAFNPYVVKAVHQAARGDPGAQGVLAEMIANRPPTSLRDLLDIVPRGPIPLAEVEPAEAIVRRFVISAMSHGALSREAHQTLAVAANRLGARSNSGEGGEDPQRYWRRPGVAWSNSRVKQIASARFGVTPEYILSADELEIKMAQGSKPGEGGQLPGHKVSDEIARIRRAQAGITLISPPPHHDIYSIEDLAQLIYDLKRVHPQARVAVKLVAEAGVGTIAAGVAKAFADTVQISGHDGGTGASPLDSIKHAGVPWELGLAETQQVLVRSALRGRVRVRVDGGMKTGRDVVIAALLGADEFGFGSAAVVALGCVMARQCHLNTCPVGVATQREDLRAKFTGTSERVVAYLLGVAEQVRELLAQLGARSVQEIVGRVELLRQKPVDHPKAKGLDLEFLLRDPDPARRHPRRNEAARNERPDDINLDLQIIADTSSMLEQGRPVELAYGIRNRDRTTGARMAGEVAAHHGDAGLPPGTVTLKFTGSAGQSFGAFLVPGLTLMLEGEANDYVGKGMAGGEIVIRPPGEFTGATHRAVIMGNTVLYGATGGRLFAAGRSGERFAVRNSGAVAVVEGAGDHGCEYMTGGVAVILGEIGHNFAAGMTGGAAYVLDERSHLAHRCNPEHVLWHRVTDPGDEALLVSLITDHARLTGSPRAADVLERWPSYAGQFWKVVPKPGASRPAQTATGQPGGVEARR